MSNPQVKQAAEIMGDPNMAHSIIFSHRHPNKSPPFHREIIDLYHSSNRDTVILTFRGSSKSTLLEEMAILKSVSGDVKSILIVGDSWARAVDRLRSVRREFEMNEWLKYLYGSQVGETWTESKLVLSNGCSLIALGQGQALRGIKHDVSRPDLCLVDDLESAESVATPDARRKLSDWFWADLMPALSPSRRVIIAATPLHPEALAVKLSVLKQYVSLVVPIEYVDDEGKRQSSWPDRFPLTRAEIQKDGTCVNDLKQLYIDTGNMAKWSQEYMVQAVDPETRLFKEEGFRFDPNITHEWQPVYVAYDPARTTKQSSATTGVVAGSFVGKKLIIWEANGYRWTPSEIIDDIFKKEQQYNPVSIGVEKDGLEEFLMQPIRQESLKRGTLIPIKALKAPKGKLEFIQRLQPYFASGDIIFAGTRDKYEETINQFLSYPTGFIDVPNALAYLIELREGVLVYEDIGERHILYSSPSHFGTCTLAVNIGPHGSAGILLRYAQKTLTIFKDWASEDSSGQAMSYMVEEARLFVNGGVQTIAPAFHFEQRTSFGLLAALRGIAEVRKGGDEVRGREFIRELLRTEAKGAPRLAIGPEALWTKKALFGGCAWEAGGLKPVSNLCCHLTSALECAVAPASYQAANAQRVAYTPDGRPYYTAKMATR